MTGGVLGTGTNSFGTRFQPKLKVLVPPIFGAIANVRNSQKTSSTSIFHETNGQDQTTPERITVASMSFSALLKVKICSRNAEKIH